MLLKVSLSPNHQTNRIPTSYYSSSIISLHDEHIKINLVPSGPSAIGMVYRGLLSSGQRYLDRFRSCIFIALSTTILQIFDMSSTKIVLCLRGDMNTPIFIALNAPLKRFDSGYII